MRRARSHMIGVAVALVGLLPAMTFAAKADAVDAAISAGVDSLFADPNYKKFGNWEEEQKAADGGKGGSVTGTQWGGRTALCTYAILASGVSPNDPRVKKPIDFLRSATINGYYAIGIRAQVWLFLPSTPENREAVLRDFKLLWAGVERDSAKRDAGLYDYNLRDDTAIDLSVSQYGVLGMWACAQLNMEVPAGDPKKNQPNFWLLVETAWRRLQQKSSGGWPYGRGPLDAVTPSMTAAGVATLFITQEYLHTRDGLTCSGNIKYDEIEKGVAFLAKALPAVLSGGGNWRFYTLYGIERIGVASGLKFLGNLDWYQAGSDYLVGAQQSDGSWPGDGAGPEVSTSFAILFLSRGREPVMINKIRYDLGIAPAPRVEGFWNERARDVANVTRFVGKQVERGLNWQIIDLSVCTVDDLHDAPIAYFSGAQTLKLAPDQIDKLRQYVEEGGTLVFNTDCGRRPFSASVTKLIADLFPGHEIRTLETDSVVLKDQQFKASNWKQKPDVKAISDGVREIAFFLDSDPAKTWQTNEYSVHNEDFALMADIYQYAIDKVHAQVKGRTHIVRIDTAIKPDKPPIKVARLIIDPKNISQSDPEPGGWRRLTAIFNNRRKTPLSVTMINPEVDDLTGYHVAHLTGVSAVTLQPATVANLKKFVEAGGVLVIDAAGGDSKFAQSVGGQLHNIFDSADAEGGPLLPSSDPLFKGDDGTPLKIEYRNFRHTAGDDANLPSLHGVKVGDHYGILFAADDLSAGLVGNEIDGIRGYTPSTATALMERILLSAKDAKTGSATTKPSSLTGKAASKAATRPGGPSTSRPTK